MQPTLDSFEIIPDRPLQTNGVPRSGWTRTRPASTWHRVYLVALVFLDFGGSLVANQISVNLFPQAGSDLINADFLDLMTLVLLPAGWIIVLWGHGAYDRRYIGVGTDEFKRVVRASWTIVAVVAFLAFASQRDLSRMSVGVALLGGLVCILLLRFMARSVLHVLRQRIGVATHRMVLVGTLPETLEVYNAITRNPAVGLLPVAIALTEGYTTNGKPTPVPV
jgi:FlaA1/EpsC-like NDP-sugar epimerase